MLEIVTQSFLKNTKLATYKGAVLYGVPESTAEVRSYDNKELNAKPTYNNAELLAIMEAGSEAAHIPSRKLLEPVRKKHQKEIDQVLQQVAAALIKGDTQKADKLMERLAFRVETWTKKFFVEPDNGWVPNAPSTIRAKKSDKPLIDTGDLRKSIKGIYVRGSSR